MVSQKQVKTSLYELNKKATIKEICDHLYTKKINDKPYSSSNHSSVSRILNVLEDWGEVRRIMRKNKEHPKDHSSDIWVIVEEKI